MALCTKCSSEEVRPLVAIDIDGTLADYHGWFVKFARRYLHQEWQQLGDYLGCEPFREWFCREFKVEEKVWRDIKLAYRQGAQKRMQPSMPGAYSLVDTIRYEGAEVWLTTTRPYLRLDNIDPDTRDWLDSMSIQYDGLIYDDDKYHILYDNIDRQRVVAVLDDIWEQYDEAKVLFGFNVPILMRNGWNRGVNRPNVAESCGEAVKMITSRVRGWKGLYQ